ncbi:ABC transporter permease [Caldicellulosiruptoraceae bacterium PP1]
MIIILWELVYKIFVDFFHIWKPYIFPSPINVIKTLYKLVLDNTLILAVYSSIKRIIIGYLLSIIIGTIIGLLITNFKFLSENLRPIILGLQTLPSICWLPFSILWFGLNENSIIFVIVIGSAFAISLAVESAIKNINPIYIKAAKNLGAYGFKTYWNVILPACLPTLISGLKQGWSFAWRALMAGEMLNSTTGLGQILMIGRELADISQVVAVMIVIIVLGLLVDNIIFGKIEFNIYQKWGLINFNK